MQKITKNYNVNMASVVSATLDNFSDIFMYWDPNAKKGFTATDIFEIINDQDKDEEDWQESKIALTRGHTIKIITALDKDMYIQNDMSPTTKQISFVLHHARIKSRKPELNITLPYLTKALVPEPLLQFRGKTIAGYKMRLEWPDLDSNQSRASTYTPNYKVGLPDVKLMNIVFSNVENERMVDAGTYFLQCFKKNILTNGTTMGQVGRHLAVMKVRDHVNSAYAKLSKKYKTALTYESFKQQCTFYKLNKLPFKLDSEKMVELDKLFQNNGYAHAIPKLNMAADSGPLLEGKNGEWVLVIFYLMDSLLQDMNSEEGSKKHSFNSLCKIKPKMEVYKRSQTGWNIDLKELNALGPEVYTELKTRNYFAFNSYAMFPLHYVLNVCQQLAGYYNDQGNHSLLGTSMFHLEFASTLKILHNNTDKLPFSFAVYADNSYNVWLIDGRKAQVSLDGEKMEASIDASEVKFMLRWFLEQFEDVSPAWRRYIEEFIPYVTMENCYGLLGNNQIRINYMPSGVPFTAQMNTVKMIRFNYVLLSLCKDAKIEEFDFFRDRKYFDLAQQIVQIKLTVESITFLDEINLDEMQVYTFDWLGFDGIPLRPFLPDDVQQTHKFNTAMLPVLNKERLIKSMAFQKKDLRPNVQAILSLIKLRALYLTGGWAYPDISQLLIARLRTLLASMKAFDEEELSRLKDEVMEDIFTSSELGVLSGLSSLASKQVVPTIYEVFALLTNEEVAQQVVLKSLGMARYLKTGESDIQLMSKLVPLTQFLNDPTYQQDMTDEILITLYPKNEIDYVAQVAQKAMHESREDEYTSIVNAYRSLQLFTKRWADINPLTNEVTHVKKVVKTRLNEVQKLPLDMVHLSAEAADNRPSANTHREQLVEGYHLNEDAILNFTNTIAQKVFSPFKNMSDLIGFVSRYSALPKKLVTPMVSYFNYDASLIEGNPKLLQSLRMLKRMSWTIHYLLYSVDKFTSKEALNLFTDKTEPLYVPTEGRLTKGDAVSTVKPSKLKKFEKYGPSKVVLSGVGEYNSFRKSKSSVEDSMKLDKKLEKHTKKLRGELNDEYTEEEKLQSRKSLPKRSKRTDPTAKKERSKPKSQHGKDEVETPWDSKP